MRIFQFVSLALSGLILSGCLTVSRGTTESLSVISNPTGATVVAELLLKSGRLDTVNENENTVLSCNPTPCTVEIPRKNHARITVRKKGYQPIKFLAVSKGSSPTSTIKPGTGVAGMAPGSHVVAGTPETITRYISGNTMTALQMLSFFGTAGMVVDSVSGANRSLSPNPVTVVLAPIKTTPVEKVEPK